ncbi:MAG: cobalamin-dependent protein, partial [Candidatus Hydrogenedentota bacterium]
MRILVLNPSSKVTKNVVRDVLYGCWCKGKRIGGGTVPPFALLQVATILFRNHEGAFLDAQAEQLDCEAVKKDIFDYDVVVISTSTMSFREDAEYLLDLKRVHPRLCTVVFGSHPTFMPQYCLAHDGIDIVVRYEPEFVLRDLMDAIMRGGDEWKSIRGIGYKEDGRYHLNEKYPFIESLDALPFPDVTLLPTRVDYFNPLVRRMPYITTTTSKGCPGKCVFCTA